MGAPLVSFSFTDGSRMLQASLICISKPPQTVTPPLAAPAGEGGPEVGKVDGLQDTLNAGLVF